MITPNYFISSLRNQNIDFFTGVPDSLLKNICAFITDCLTPENNIITANEGAAVALATGYYLSTKKIPVVYMQNSGIGNAVNPLLSLTDKEVYNIPILFLIGWRGEPETKDEPQHKKQGRVTIPLLNIMGIKNEILSQDESKFEWQLNEAISYMTETKEPFVFLVQKNTFSEYKLQKTKYNNYLLEREEAIKKVTNSLGENDIVVATTGMISRELFEYREERKQGHSKDFLTVGSMGHASQIALGIALQKKRRKVYCFDGDGALLMHFGAMCIIGTLHPQNFIHVVFNNGAHDSVGGQPTVGFDVDLPKIALACGYNKVYSVADVNFLDEILNQIGNINGPLFLEIKVKRGARKDLGRPYTTPIQNKKLFMDYLNK